MRYVKWVLMLCLFFTVAQAADQRRDHTATYTGGTIATRAPACTAAVNIGYWGTVSYYDIAPSYNDINILKDLNPAFEVLEYICGQSFYVSGNTEATFLDSVATAWNIRIDRFILHYYDTTQCGTRSYHGLATAVDWADTVASRIPYNTYTNRFVRNYNDTCAVKAFLAFAKRRFMTMPNRSRYYIDGFWHDNSTIALSNVSSASLGGTIDEIPGHPTYTHEHTGDATYWWWVNYRAYLQKLHDSMQVWMPEGHPGKIVLNVSTTRPCANPTYWTPTLCIDGVTTEGNQSTMTSTGLRSMYNQARIDDSTMTDHGIEVRWGCRSDTVVSSGSGAFSPREAMANNLIAFMVTMSELSSFYQQKSSGPTNLGWDTLGWKPINNYDLGPYSSFGARQTVDTGHSADGKYYEIWKRSGSKGFLLFRPRESWNQNATPTDVVRYNLGGSYYEILPTGTLTAYHAYEAVPDSQLVTYVDLRPGQGKMFSLGEVIGPALSVDHLTMTFDAVSGDPAPASQGLDINNSGAGTLNWTATDDQTWLSVSDASGTAPSSISISVNHLGLAAGTYYGTVTVTGTDADYSPREIAVTLHVQAAVSPPHLQLTPGSYEFNVVTGGTPPAATTFDIANTGGGTSNWTTSVSENWLTVDKASGSGAATISVWPVLTDLTPGTYTATVSVVDHLADNSPQTFNVSYVVAPLNPSVSPPKMRGKGKVKLSGAVRIK